MDRVSLIEMTAAVGGRACRVQDRETGFRGVGIDSRTITQERLFWAVRGERHDGHDYTGEAVRRGAVACVVDEGREHDFEGPAIVVPDTHEALGAFARWYRRTKDALVIGITGSVGKTTTREMLHAALAISFGGVRSPKNFNNHFGVPLSLLEIRDDHEFAVLEMGASHVGEIRQLAGIAEPEVGVVTAVGPSHLEGFGSVDRIIQAKGELVEALPENGFAVLNGDDPRVRSMAARAACPVIFVGENEHDQVRATHVRVDEKRLAFRVDGRAFEVPVTGRHHLTAALVAVAVGREIGMDLEAVAEGLRRFTPVEGRCRTERIGDLTVIDDSYNANPSSMQAACRLLHDWPGKGKRLLVIGDMLELGDRATDFHRDLGRQAADCGIDHVLVLGERSEHVVRGAIEAGMPPHRLAQFRELDMLLAVLDCWLESGDVVLVKGSRSMRMERVVERLRDRITTVQEANIARVPTRACA